MKNLLFDNCVNYIHKAGLVLLYGMLCLNTTVQAQNDTVIDVHPNHYYFGSNDIEVAYDGGYILDMSGNNIGAPRFISKLNRKGETLWTVKPHSSEDGDVLINDVEFLSTGEMILSGHTFKYHHPDYPSSRQADGLLIKIGTCGEVEWLNIETRLEGIRIGDGLRQMDVSDSDEIWVNHYCGYGVLRDSLTDGRRGAQMIMNKYNSDGELLAKTEDEDVVGFDGYINDVIALDDGGCIVSGYGYSIMPYYNQVYSDTNHMGYTRSIVIKYDADASVEWYHVYKWEDDQYYDSQVHTTKEEYEKIVISSGSWMIPTDSNTFIVSGLRKYYDADDYGGRYNKQFLYEIDLEGNVLRDTLYNQINSQSFAPIKQLDDTTLFIVNNPVDFGQYAQDYWAELEVWRIDSRTFDVTGRWADTTYAYYPTSKIEISHEGKVLIMTYRSDGIGTQIRVLNPETMRLDTIPTIDTHVYDSLCSGVYTPEDYVLPADTTQWEPIGYVELEPQNNSIEYLQNDKALLLVNVHSGGAYQLINVSGQVIETGNLESGVIHKDVSYLPTGFYQVRLESENKTYHEKFIVQ